MTAWKIILLKKKILNYIKKIFENLKQVKIAKFSKIHRRKTKKKLKIFMNT